MNNVITAATTNNSMAAAAVAAVTNTNDDSDGADADAAQIIVDIDDDDGYVRSDIGEGGGVGDGDAIDADIYASRNLHSRTRLRHSPIFQNEFAVYVPNGEEMADSIAGKYGFSNMGQVSFAVRRRTIIIISWVRF